MTGRRHRKSSKNRGEWDGNISELALVGKGGTGFVFAIDKARVVKIPAGSDISIRAFKREREAFKILGQQGQNQFLLACLDYHLPDRLVLERCESTVRERLQHEAMECSNDSPRWRNPAFMKSSIAWACQAAAGLSFVHSKKIVHADVGCHNMLLDTHGNVKISDFSGSGMFTDKKGYLPALVTYDERSRKPGTSGATVQTDIFALGSAIYELATGHLPYSDLPNSQVRSLFARKQWPDDLESIKAAFPAMRNAIYKCWEGAYHCI
ncbi:kinase-like domain-containing protein [Plectosphaerella plurivora]|uniref:Kinase-like domain-containing protein n=1 Tax=Plectosphaerella plurivora TaxID=936078 RepID=A0A9P8V5V7_9PEZI|nr:kinase-like domain-containing protein [Plectosphaerella plurivora]